MGRSRVNHIFVEMTRIHIMIKKVQINNIPVWFYTEQLSQHSHSNREELVPSGEYICYFKFTEPTSLIHGELLKDEYKRPKLFTDSEEAVVYGMKCVKQLLNL